jgi:sugar/nucleoside kinase (ribokinase family)
MPDIIAIGEILVEIMRPSAGQPLDRNGEFRGPFASGAPAIFAVASSRLGQKTAFIGAVGRDAFGKLLEQRLVDESVDIGGLQHPSGYTTGAAFVAYDESGEREFVFHIRHAAAGQLQAKEVPTAIFKDVKWLHISGSTLALNPNSYEACKRALELTRAQGGKISLDPNLRLELMPLEEFREILAPFLDEADLVLPTAREARLLTEIKDDELAATSLAKKSGAIVALKRAEHGCTIYQGSDKLDLPGYHIEEVDPTGAGDCFSAAFIAGLQEGLSLDKVGTFANAAGALAVTKLGPMEGVSTREQVLAFQ